MEDVRLCLARAAYSQERSPASIVRAIEISNERQMRAPTEGELQQVYVERQIVRVLRYLKQKNAAFLDVFPDIKRLQRRGWPMYTLFREGEMAALGHLFRYR